MQEAVSRFPLQWPSGWTRTVPHRRANATFRTKSVTDNRLTVAIATDRLQREVEALGAKSPLLSTNVELRLDGRPRSDHEPADPGVAIYFTFKGRATVFACDKYKRVADNIGAIAAHIDALRRIERYGVGSLEQALAGYKSLPADSAADWRTVFGFPKLTTPTFSMVREKYLDQVKIAHPDKGGTDEQMFHINRALDYADKELNG